MELNIVDQSQISVSKAEKVHDLKTLNSSRLDKRRKNASLIWCHCYWFSTIKENHALFIPRGKNDEKKELRMDVVYLSGRSTVRASFWNSSTESRMDRQVNAQHVFRQWNSVSSFLFSFRLHPLGQALIALGLHAIPRHYPTACVPSIWSWWILGSCTGLTHQGKSWASGPKPFLLLVKLYASNLVMMILYSFA